MAGALMNECAQKKIKLYHFLCNTYMQVNNAIM